MSPRVLSVAPPLLSLFFFSAFVVALIDVTANCTLSSFSWAFNSIGQSPCVVAANMLALCYSGTYPLNPLPSGWIYDGPSRNYPNGCGCSTIGYSLISACVACQGNQPLDWGAFTGNCTPASTLPPSRFPYPVPVGIRVPHWAILDVTQEYSWDSEQARLAGDTPEYGPGAIFGASGVYTSGVSTSSTSASPTPTYTHSHSGGHAGPIAGGVIGGIAIIAIAAVAAIFYIRRRRSQAAAVGVDYYASQPTLNDGMVAQPPSMKFHDPTDRATMFSGYQGGPQSPDISPTSQAFSSHVGSGSTLTSMSTSLPHSRGYHGLPMPSA